MAEIGQDAPRLIARRTPAIFAALAVAVAASGALWMWPFTIDDASISVRYARHLATGVGYRFNVGGASTDGVTPLPWPLLLLPLARGTGLSVLARAKCLGFIAWLATAGLWGHAVARADAPWRSKLLALAGLAVSVPLAAHAVSGMETSVATALATGAALLHARPRAAAILAGLGAALRPELLPWAIVLSCMLAAGGESASARRVATCGFVALVPFLACVGVRIASFGSPAPLAVMAKPSDLGHGVAYAMAAALAAVGPLMAFAPVAAIREKGPGRAIVASGAAHLVAVALVGGDWMPYARLVAPVCPSLLYAAVLLAFRSSLPVEIARAGLAIALGLRVLVESSSVGRHTGPDRAELTRRVAGLLTDAQRVAAVDVGWVSLATEVDLVDLAGATDPEIAALGGGHTSKRVDGSILHSRGADVLLLFAQTSGLPVDRWREASFPRVVEARLARDELVAEDYRPEAFVPLGSTGIGYYVLRRR